MADAIKISHISKEYEGFKLDDVSFHVPMGSIVGFIGENGAGKSTTIKMIIDAIKPSSGEIFIQGVPNREYLKTHASEIGVVMEDCLFHENLNAKELCKTMELIYKGAWDQNKAQDYIKKFELPEKKIIKEYSKGMKMKLALTIAFSHNAKILIMDEATSGLDPITRDEMLDIMLDFISDEEHAILMSSHILSDLEKACDYISFIHKGKLLFMKEKDLLLEEYGVLKCTKEELEAIDKEALVNYRENRYSIEALVKRDLVPSGFTVDKATIEDIMLFYARGNEVC